VRDINLRTIHQHSHPPILGKFGTYLGYAAAVRLAPTAPLVTISVVVWPRVPSCLREAIAIVFNDVHFHASWLPLRLDIAIIAGFEVTGVGRDEVKVVIDATVGCSCVNVKFNVPAKQVEGLPAVHTTTSSHGPTVSIPTATINLEIFLRWAPFGRRAWRRRRTW